MLAFYDRYRRTVPGGAASCSSAPWPCPTPQVPGVRTSATWTRRRSSRPWPGPRRVLCPSPYESLSIVLLEGFALGTPGLVNARSAVLEDHCRRSNAGSTTPTADEFAEALDLLVRWGPMHDVLSRNGRAYVRDHYAWPSVMARYRGLIEAVRAL